MSQAGQVQRDGRARGATAVPVREGGVKERGSQDPTPHSSTVAWTVEGGLEGVKEKKGARIWALKHAKKRGGGRAPVKGSLALKGAGVHVFMCFGRQVMLG